MGGVMKLIGTVLIVAALIAAVAMPSEAAITCGEVFSYLGPCIPILTGGSRGLGGCCDGIKALFGSAKTTPDKRSICNCLKIIPNSSLLGINITTFAGLPAQCGINIPYKIGPSTDCSKVQ